MLSWEKLNAIIETRMEVPLKTDLTAIDETETEEIAFYNQLKSEEFSEVDWVKDNLQTAARKYTNCLLKKHPELSIKSAENLANRVAYNSWK